MRPPPRARLPGRPRARRRPERRAEHNPLPRRIDLSKIGETEDIDQIELLGGQQVTIAITG
jgi:hypothetical protein